MPKLQARNRPPTVEERLARLEQAIPTIQEVLSDLPGTLDIIRRTLDECREQIRILSAQLPFTPDPNDEIPF